MEKRGLSHVEVVISFVIFISFIMFLFLFLNPLETESIKNSLIDVAHLSIIERISVDVIKSTVTVDDGELNKISEDCFYVEPISDKNVVVFDKENNNAAVNATLEIILNKLNIEKGIGRVFPILHSEDLIEIPIQSPISCGYLDGTNYTIGITQKFKIPSFKRIKTMEAMYNEQYDTLRNEMNFPLDSDFAFSIREANDNIIINMNKNIALGLNVIARDVNTQIIYENGTIVSGIMNIRVW